jgi:hypothetical protein
MKTAFEVLLAELGQECTQVLKLINQLQLSDLSPSQKVNILSDLLSSTVHLNVITEIRVGVIHVAVGFPQAITPTFVLFCLSLDICRNVLWNISTIKLISH